jgi:mannosyl-oligosaccharide glucosidase
VAEEAFHVCHKGYVTVLPLMLSLVPASSDRLEHLLSDLRDPTQLWSDWGILSLSRQDPFFGTAEDYWRGSIWIQMNYLVLQALFSVYAQTPGPQQVRAATIYGELRENVVGNIISEFRRTGSVWEQYNAKTGAGQRSRPFTGWTALVVNIMAERY